jgi:tyrosine-specific transport protein
MGPIGEGATALLFWFLLTSIVTAYTSEGGELVAEVAREQLSVTVPPFFAATVFIAFFAGLDFFGTERVDIVNRILVLGLVSSFLGLLLIGIPNINSSLLSRVDWATVYPNAISVGILSFGAQNVVPTLLRYLGGDPKRTQQAVLIGSLIPLAMYCIWEALFLGIVPYDPNGAKMEVVSALGNLGGTIVQDLVEVFSACAIGSSMAGASVSLVDFFQDAMALLTDSDNTHESVKTDSNVGKRLLSSVLALGPPLTVAFVYPDAFLGILENAGLIGGVSLYGLLPSFWVYQLRKNEGRDGMMPGRIVGGSAGLGTLFLLSLALILPDIFELAQGVLQ